ncbi:MAG: flagellar biosynthesis anti-sigma factor FlgM [Pseudomonadota bacterium]
MTIEIKGLNLTLLKNSQEGAAAPETRGNAAARPGGGQGADADAVVNFTGDPARLRELEQGLAGVPVIDMEHVERIRAALDKGFYQIVDARVADKLMQFEQQLGKSGD